MIAHEGLLRRPAERAGIAVPSEEEYENSDYPHWTVFINAQIGRPLPWPTAHWDNAGIVAEVSDKEILKITLGQLVERGFR